VRSREPELAVDLAASIATLGAPDLESAVRAATAVDTRGVPASIACGLVRQLRFDGLRDAAMLPGAHLYHVSAGSPGCVSNAAAALDAQAPDLDALAPLVEACDGGTLTCDPRRPVCESLDESAAVAFAGEGGALRVSNVLIVDPQDDD
jgi:hypothetical protein